MARLQLAVGTRAAVSAAASTLERCRRFAPDDPDTMAMLRAAYTELGQPERVRAIELSVRWSLIDTEPVRARWPQG